MSEAHRINALPIVKRTMALADATLFRDHGPTKRVWWFSDGSALTRLDNGYRQVWCLGSG